MSLYEDYQPCRNCGCLTDSGVCSAACADELDAAAAERQAAAWAALGLCTNCGEQPCATCGRCHDCDNLEDHLGDSAQHEGGKQ